MAVDIIEVDGGFPCLLVGVVACVLLVLVVVTICPLPPGIPGAVSVTS